MRIRPVPPLHRHRRLAGEGRVGRGDRPFILRSELGATILRMISTHSLPAFTPAIDRPAPGPAPAQAPRQASGPAAPAVVEVAAAPASPRALDAVPAQPARPVPRGSLLDLRV
jgi:hypothetical protein